MRGPEEEGVDDPIELYVRGAIALETLEEAPRPVIDFRPAAVEHDYAVGAGARQEPLIALGEEHQRGGVCVLVCGEETRVRLAPRERPEQDDVARERSARQRGEDR